MPALCTCGTCSPPPPAILHRLQSKKFKEPIIPNQIYSIKPTKLNPPNQFYQPQSRETKSTVNRSELQSLPELSLVQLSPGWILITDKGLLRGSALSLVMISENVLRKWNNCQAHFRNCFKRLWRRKWWCWEGKWAELKKLEDTQVMLM